MVVKSRFIFVCVCVCGCVLCVSVFIMTFVSTLLSQSSMVCPRTMTRISQSRLLNPSHLIQGGYHRKYEEMRVILVLLLSLSGARSNRTACEGDTVPAPCTKRCTACLQLIFLKIPSQLLKWSLGGDCRKCMRHSSGVLQSCNIQCDVL